MKMVIKDTSELDAMVAAYKNAGGSTTKGKTRAMPHGLQISNNAWGQSLTREEKAAKNASMA